MLEWFIQYIGAHPELLKETYLRTWANAAKR